VVESLRLGEGLMEETLAVLRACGQGRRECVAFWTGPADTPEAVDAVLHPEHRSGPHGYSICDAWLDRTWRELGRRRRAVRAQVHTHPGPAFHSETDDRFPIVHTPGFLSLVLPRFGEGPQTLENAYLARLDASGGWTALDPLAVLGGAVAR
jgi:hypothetical protein